MTGHHCYYLRWIIDLYINNGHRVTLALLNESLGKPVAKNFLNDYKDKIKVITSEANMHNNNSSGLLNLLKQNYFHYKLSRGFYKRLSTTCHIDLVFSPYLDNYLYAVAILGSPFDKTSWSGIVMRPSFHYIDMGIIAPKSRLDLIKKWLFMKVLSNKSLNSIFTIDESLYDYINERFRKFSSKLKLIPDPAEMDDNVESDQSCKLLNLPINLPVLLVYGALTPRKGIYELIEAASSELFPKDLLILFAGEQDSYVREIMNSSSALKLKENHRLYEINRHITKAEEYAVFSSADIVWVGYLDHYQMSGVLVQSGMMKLPVIACEVGIIGWLTTRNKTGDVISINDPKSIALSVNKLLSSKTRYKKYSENAYKYYSKFTIEKAQKIILNETIA